jgi:outer membrane receptor protein involved in Fe transport
MTLLLVLAQAAIAAAPAAAPLPVAAPATAAASGLIAYPASYFADARPGTALDMVNRLPGFILDSGSSVRGFEGAAGNVLINGQRPASKGDTIDQVLQRIQAGQVDHIDIIRGGAPGIDMQGKTVLANVVTKSGGGWHALLSGTEYWVGDGRNIGGLRAEASGDQGGRPWEVSLRYGGGVDDGDGDGPGRIRFADGRPDLLEKIGTEGDSQQYIASGSYQLPVFGGKLKLGQRLDDSKYKADETDQIYQPFLEVDHSGTTQVVHELESSANFTRSLGAKASMDLLGLRTIHHERDEQTFDSPGEHDFFHLGRRSNESIGRGVLKYAPRAGLSFEAGGEFAVNKLDSDSRYVVDGEDVPLPSAQADVKEKRSEIFAKSTWRPASAWTVDTALRYESSNISSHGDVQLEKTLHFLKPRLAVSWTPDPSTQLRVRFERVVGQLDFDDFVASANLANGTGVVAGNPDLVPEQAWVSEAAIEQHRFGMTAVLTYRHSALKDAIDRAPVFAPNGVVFDTPANIGSGKKDELIFELTVPFDAVGLRGAQFKGDVTKRWSSVTDPTTHQTRPITELRPLEWEANFTQDLPRWNASYGIDVFGGWRQTYYRFDLIDTYKLTTYLKPFAEWRPRPDITLRVELPNITGRGFHETLENYPGPRNLPGAPDITTRDLMFSRGFWIRVQKRFGG